MNISRGTVSTAPAADAIIKTPQIIRQKRMRRLAEKRGLKPNIVSEIEINIRKVFFIIAEPSGDVKPMSIGSMTNRGVDLRTADSFLKKANGVGFMLLTKERAG